MEAVWKGVAKYNNLTAQQLGAADIVALNQFICGLNSSEIESLNKDAFKFVQHTHHICGFFIFFQFIFNIVCIYLTCISYLHEACILQSTITYF